MELSHAQKQAIYRDGYVKLEGILPKARVDAALRAINHSVGEGMPVEQMTRFRAQSYCPELQREPVLTDLLNRTPAWELAESALGAGNIRPAGDAQVALRFPTLQDPPPPPRPHLDGMYSPTNGVQEGTIQNFTMLVGVFLSDVPGPFCGNFTVWPGTHHQYEAYFREHGPESLLKGMPPIPLPEPTQVTARAGDVALVHYELAHSVAANASPNARYALFFRLNHVNHADQKLEVMTDIWREWDGIRSLAER